MNKRNIGLSAALALVIAMASSPTAFAINVVASIKPVHALVSAVMEGVGTPHLLVSGNASPHAYSLRPSDADALQNADVVFWVGPELEIFLQTPLETLSHSAVVVTLIDTPNLILLPQREGGTFEAHDDETPEPVHQAQAGDHIDMHIWLDPENAKAMLSYIADTLAKADPDHAALYLQNAQTTSATLDQLEIALKMELRSLSGLPYVVFHDAYQYFENRFEIPAAGSITVSPETIPGVRRIAEIRDKIEQLEVICVFAEPQFSPRIIETVTEGTMANIGVLDPLGTEIEGPDFYVALMRGMARSFDQCMKS